MAARDDPSNVGQVGAVGSGGAVGTGLPQHLQAVERRLWADPPKRWAGTWLLARAQAHQGSAALALLERAAAVHHDVFPEAAAALRAVRGEAQPEAAACAMPDFTDAQVDAAFSADGAACFFNDEAWQAGGAFSSSDAVRQRAPQPCGASHFAGGDAGGAGSRDDSEPDASFAADEEAAAAEDDEIDEDEIEAALAELEEEEEEEDPEREAFFAAAVAEEQAKEAEDDDSEPEWVGEDLVGKKISIAYPNEDGEGSAYWPVMVKTYNKRTKKHLVVGEDFESREDLNDCHWRYV